VAASDADVERACESRSAARWTQPAGNETTPLTFVELGSRAEAVMVTGDCFCAPVVISSAFSR